MALSDKFSGDLGTRVVTAVPLALAVLLLLYLGGIWFTMLLILAGLIMIREWDNMTREWGVKWQIAGLAYAALPCISLIWLREQTTDSLPQAGLGMVLWLFFIVWSTDIGAYFAGRLIGGPKIAPSISPNKTWAGLVGGMVAAGLIGVAASKLVYFPTTVPGCFSLGAILAVVAQAGDFFESWLKRRAGVKDSGRLIPGHGGLLDRIDGLVTAAPVFAALALFFG